VGPNPTDRGEQGTKHHLVVDGQGTPLAAVLSGANRNDCKVKEAAVDAIPPVRNGKPGRPRFRPEKLHTEQAVSWTLPPWVPSPGPTSLSEAFADAHRRTLEGFVDT
jgi:hypothetical protein